MKTKKCTELVRNHVTPETSVLARDRTHLEMIITLFVIAFLSLPCVFSQNKTPAKFDVVFETTVKNGTTGKIKVCLSKNEKQNSNS